MTRYFLTVFAAVLLAFCSSSCFAQGINWQSELESAAQQASRENKLVLLHFGASWCRPCRELETFVFTNPRVHRSMNENVIPVKIDVDEHPNLVKEYGVASVPFDVVLTPAGRVVGKRSSPRDASSYSEMINGFNRVINGLAQGNPALHEQLDQLKDQVFTDNQIVENQSFQPAMPVHRAPVASRDSAELKRKSRVINPFIDKAKQTPAKVAENLPANQDVGHVARSTEPTTVKNPMAMAATTGKNKKISNDFARNSSPAKKLAQGASVSRTKNEAAVVTPAFVQGTNNSKKVAAKSKQKLSVANHSVKNLPAAAEPAKAVDNSFFPDKVVANSTDFAASNAAKTKIESETSRAIQESVTGKSRLVGQTDFQPVDHRGDLEHAVKTAKVQANSHQAKDKSVSASLVIPPGNPATINDFEDQEKIASGAPGKAQIILDSKSNDFAANEMKIDSQTAVNTAVAKSTTKRELPKNIALQGKCPVTLLQKGVWEDGDPKWGCVHRDRTYLFTSEANLRKFQKNPDANSPLLAGFDPVVFHRSGKLVSGKEKHGVFMGKVPNQRVVLFESAKTRAEFETNPKNYITTIRQAMQAANEASANLLR